MPYLVVRHRVEDYAKWKPVFDEHEAFRKASGSRGGMVFRSADNLNEVIIILEWDTLANARKFAAAQDLGERMQRGGVSDIPDIYFLEEVAKPPA